MAITSARFVTLPFDEGLSLAGVEYTKRNLMQLRERHEPLTLDVLREHAALTAVRLAFRRWLEQGKVPYRVSQAGLPGEPGQGTIFIGGRRCEMETSVATSWKVVSLSSEETLLDCQVCARQHTAMEAGQEGTDLLVFAAAQIDVIRSRQESEKRLEGGMRIEMAALLPDEWLRPRLWQPMSNVIVTNGTEVELTIEAVGYDRGRREIVEEIKLGGNETRQLAGKFYTLGGFFSRDMVRGEITIQAEQKGKTFKAGQHRWGNIWVYGQKVLLLGYLPRGNYRSLARERPGARKLPGSDHTSPGVRVRELRPMGELQERVKDWGRQSR